MQGEPAWEAAEFFVLRTPLLPLEALLGLGEGLAAARCGGQPDLVDAAVRRDRLRVRARLRALYGRADVREALSVASSSLTAGLDAWEHSPDSRRGRNAEHSLLRYLARMSARPTPFGLFAGCSVGSVDPTADGPTALELGPSSSYRRRTGLDFGYLGALTADLRRRPEVRRHLVHRPNSSLYRSAGRLRYVEVLRTDAGPTHRLVEVEPVPWLLAAVDRAGPGARPDELVAAVVAAEPDVEPGEAGRAVEELIEHQILVPELELPVSGPEPLADLLAQVRPFAERAGLGPVTAALDAARRQLATADRRPPGEASGHYARAAALLTRPPVAADPSGPSGLFRIDLVKPAARAVLGRAVAAEVLRGARLLHRLGGTRPDPQLARFTAAYRTRYGAREVPLCEALDPESGLGFPVRAAPMAAAEPLLAGLDLAGPGLDGFGLDGLDPEGLDLGGQDASGRPVDGEKRWDGRHRLLLTWLGEAMRTGARELALGPERLDALTAADESTIDRPPLPDSFGVVASILAESPQAVARGRYRVHISALGGPSGAYLLGRFCHDGDDLTRCVRAHLRAEEALRPDAVFAEIAHLPGERIGNVLRRPLLRGHEIPCLGRSGAPPDQQIPLADLTLVPDGDRLALRSTRLGAEVLPRLTSAHHFAAPANLGLYRFLCALQAPQQAHGLDAVLGPLAAAPYLPRIVSGRLVLARARWNLTERRLARFAVQSPSERFVAVQELRRELGLPRWVAVAEGDRLLPVDLENTVFLDMAARLLDGRSTATMAELFLGDEEVLARGPEGRFTHEVVVPFVRTGAHPPGYPRAHPPARRADPGPPRADEARPCVRSFPPGSEWLYAKLYTGSAGADETLRRVVRPLVRSALAEGAADSWFYVRYADPEWHLRVRLHGDRRRLAADVLPVLYDAAQPLLAEGVVRRVQLDTYEREIERYGGPDGIRLSELLFRQDSEAALRTVESLGAEGGTDSRWRAALVGIDRLLTELGLPRAEKRALVSAARDRFRAEFRVDQAVRRGIGDRFRRERAALENLLAGPGPADDTSAAVRSLAAELREGVRTGQIGTPIAALAGNYVHLHANRVLRSAARAQELLLYDFLSRLYAAPEAGAVAPSARPSRRSTIPSEPIR
ncbi:lantibiotic dehydratase [Kitasatospora sp. NPDC058063]|uniref:lantibiotic dehydratase n=1 Tax=unclassified Kitasatospora TaxID=2633591 RepID=UPI0036D78069